MIELIDVSEFGSKIPLYVIGEIRRSVVNGVYAGAMTPDKKERFFVMGLSKADLSSLGINSMGDVADLHSTDQAGKVTVVRFNLDKDHIGFLFDDYLKRLFQNSVSLKRLTTIPWRLYEVVDGYSETPFLGRLQPTPWKVPYDKIGELLKQISKEGVQGNL